MWKPLPVKSCAGILYALSYYHVFGSKNEEGCCRKMWMDVVHRFDLASIFYWQLFDVWKHGRDLGKYFGSFLQSFLYPILKVWWEILTSISQCNPAATDLFKVANNSWLAWIVKFHWALLYWDLLRDAVLPPSWEILKWSNVEMVASAEKSLLLDDQPGIPLRITFVS